MKALDALAGPLACRLLTRPQPAPESIGTIADHPGRLLVIRPGGIGDMLLLLPSLTRLRRRYPDRPLDLLCESRNAAVPILAGLDVSLLIYDRRPLQAVTLLRRRSYAAAIDSEQFHHFSAVMAMLSGAPVRIGFNVAPRRNGLYTHLADYALTGREDQQFARLFQLTDCDVESPGAGFAGCLRQVALPALPDAIIRQTHTPLLVVHPGGAHPNKQIPLSLLAEVCDTARHRHGLAVVFTGGPDEADRGARLQRRIKGAVNLCGRLPLAQTAALFRRATVFLGPDSGMTHLAVALGTPCITLFGPTDPRKWAVAETHQTILREPQPCSPCALFGYTKPCRGIYCMQSIEPGPILQAIRNRLHDAPA